MPEVRQARVSDHRAIVGCVQSWWGDVCAPEQARELSLLLPRLFLQFFSGTSLVVEDGGEITAFLVGFYAADNESEAYIHFVGVDPKSRRAGVARLLYSTFFQRAAEAGRREIRAVTSPRNTGSIAFHRAMGFTLEEGDRDVDELPVHSDYDGPGHDRVCFHRMVPFEGGDEGPPVLPLTVGAVGERPGGDGGEPAGDLFAAGAGEQVGPLDVDAGVDKRGGDPLGEVFE